MKQARARRLRFGQLMFGTLVAALAFACSDDPPPLTAPSLTAPAGPIFPPGFSTSTDADTNAPQMQALWGEVVDNSARVMVAGTLMVTPDGTYAVASDSERDVIYVVELALRKARRIALQPADEPGRIVSGSRSSGTLHVYTVLRQAHAVVDLDLGNDATVRTATCKAPRGITYDEVKNLVHVACASGELVSYDADGWSEKRRIFVAPDLKDVEVVGDRLVLSRYTSAEVLILNEELSVVARAAPQAAPACATAAIAHRLLVRGEHVYLSHQLASTELVGAEVAQGCVPQVASLLTKEPLDEFTAAPASVWQHATPVVPIDGARLDVGEGGAPFAATWSWSSGPSDIAIGSNDRVVVSLAGNHWSADLAPLVTLEPEASDAKGSFKTIRAFRPAGMITSVAFDAADEWLAFSREPAALYFEDQSPLFLGGGSVNNSGFSLFHMNSGAGIACVSCHPEGGHDNHVWRFPYATRSTLPARGARAPFNWEHRTSNMDTLLSEVLFGQMEYPLNVNSDQAGLLQLWLSRLPQYDTASGAGDAVARGQALFASAEVGCASCHAGTVYTDYGAHDVGTGGAFATPSLVGLGVRENFLHDGCAASLEDVFGVCGGSHQSVQSLKREQVEDLLAFLSSR